MKKLVKVKFGHSFRCAEKCFTGVVLHIFAFKIEGRDVVVSLEGRESPEARCPTAFFSHAHQGLRLRAEISKDLKVKSKSDSTS